MVGIMDVRRQVSSVSCGVVTGEIPGFGSA
jgi:hypothetical protein